MQPASIAPTATSQPAAHFVFNSLNLLQAFIQEGDRSGALAYLSRFSRLLRQWLQHATKSSVPLSAETALLESYLSLERDRFAASFEYVVVQEVPCADMVLVKPLAWQAVVEHALYNDILQASGRGLLRITFTRDSDGSPVCHVLANPAAPGKSLTCTTTEQTVSLTP